MTDKNIRKIIVWLIIILNHFFCLSSFAAWTSVAPILDGEELESMIVYNDTIYAGGGTTGSLYEWNGTDAWVEVAPQLNSQTDIWDLYVFNGALYGSTNPGFKLFEWNDSNSWVEVADTLGGSRGASLTEFEGSLYCGGANYCRLMKWNGVNAWTQEAYIATVTIGIKAIVVYNGELYGSGIWGELREFDDDAAAHEAWSTVSAAHSHGTNFIYSMIVYNGNIYLGSYNSGELFEWDGVVADLVEVADTLNGQDFIQELLIIDDELYGITSDLDGSGCRLFKWNDVDAWEQIEGQAGSELYGMGLVYYNSKVYAIGLTGVLYESDAEFGDAATGQVIMIND